jgi:hypothetical protein
MTRNRVVPDLAAPTTKASVGSERVIAVDKVESLYRRQLAAATLPRWPEVSNDCEVRDADCQ